MKSLQLLPLMHRLLRQKARQGPGMTLIVWKKQPTFLTIFCSSMRKARMILQCQASHCQHRS